MDSKLKILNLATTLEGGAGAGMRRYHEALLAAGADSRILVAHDSGPASPRLATFGWKKPSILCRVLIRLGWDTRPHQRLRRQLATLDRSAPKPPDYEIFSLPFSDYCPEHHPWIEEFDIILVHWISGTLDWPRFFQRVRRPVVFVLHDQQPYLGGFHYELDAVNNLHLASLEKHVLAVKHRSLPPRLAVIANSAWNARRARASGFFTASTEIETIYYPINSTLYAPQPRSAAQSAAGIPQDRLVIGFACENLKNPRKGFAELLHALKLLPAELRARVTLLSFGNAPEDGLSGSLGLPWVHLGFLRDDSAKVAAYSAMHVFVAPSRAEAFGLTALEAEACGIPVIAAPIGGLAEAVVSPLPLSPEQPATPENLATALAQMLPDEALRERLALAGRRLACERHAPAVIGRQLVDFINRQIHSTDLSAS